jgi:two-component system, OmpR family, sensor kinase
VRSLRRRLLVSLWLTLALVGLSSAVVTYLVTRQETNSLLDYQMEEIATYIGAQPFSGSVEPAVTARADFKGDIDDAFFVSVRDAAGRVLYASRPGLETLPPDLPGFHTVTLGRTDYRVFSARSGEALIAVAQKMELRREAAAGAALAALLPVVMLIPILGLVITLVLRRQLRPLDEAAREVAGRPPLALEPLPIARLPAEVVPLVDEINRLLARLTAASEREQRFIVDAAHALRTPLAALQLQADVLESSADPTTRATRVAELRAGIRRTVRLSNHLLQLAHEDGVMGPDGSRFSLDAALTDAFELYAPIAAARGVRLHIDAVSGAVVPGTARHVAQLAGSLIDNAVRHTPSGGSVAIRATIEADRACIAVVDEGPGLPEAELARVFERFYRIPGDATEGSGLGLALVRDIATSLGGGVTLENRKDRSGLRARVWLPLDTAAPSNAGAGQSACA